MMDGHTGREPWNSCNSPCRALGNYFAHNAVNIDLKVSFAGAGPGNLPSCLSSGVLACFCAPFNLSGVTWLRSGWDIIIVTLVMLHSLNQ